jgi:hypothetical protein
VFFFTLPPSLIIRSPIVYIYQKGISSSKSIGASDGTILVTADEVSAGGKTSGISSNS